MTLSRKTNLKIDRFNFGVSYKLDEKKLSFKDARNVQLKQGRLEKRHGTWPLSLANLSNPQSISFFKTKQQSRFYIVRLGSSFVKVDADGDTTVIIRSDLSAIQKHRGLTWNNDRHIITNGTDGVFQYNGVTLTQVGQNQPAVVPSISAGGLPGSIPAGTYQGKISFYSTATGFESNPSSATAQLVVTAGQSIKISSIPTSASNATIDTVRVYLKRTTQADYIFYIDIPLGQAEVTIQSESFSSQTPVDNAASPPSGNVIQAIEFNRRLVLIYENEARGSNQEDPDAFDDGEEAFIIAMSGDGPMTGGATGLFNNSVLDPYLVLFKENKTAIYSEIGGESRLVELNENIGCVSPDTIIRRNGNIYFMSKFGFYGISNGRLITKDGQPYRLGGDDIRDIFEYSDLEYMLSTSRLKNSFSFYHQERDSYVTFIYEGNNNKSYKAYAYDFETDSFLPWEFPYAVKHATTGEDTNGIECPILLQNNEENDITKPNLAMKFYGRNQYSDKYYLTEADATFGAISAYAILNWVDGNDYERSYNYREYILRVKRGQPDVTLKAWVNFTYKNEYSNSFELPEPDATFILDQSQLDVDALGEGRDVVTARTDVNLCGESILLGFYQSENSANMVISSAQLNFSRNGNRNA